MINLIPIDQITDYWDKVEPLFQRVISSGTEYLTTDNVLAALIEDKYALVVVETDRGIQAAAVFEIIICPNQAKVLMSPLMSGDGMEEWLTGLVGFMYKAAAERGCNKMLLSGRPGWTKVMKPLGGDVSYVTIEYDVNRWCDAQSRDS